MGELQQIWDNENDRLSELHRVRTGIRSTQLGNYTLSACKWRHGGQISLQPTYVGFRLFNSFGQRVKLFYENNNLCHSFRLHNITPFLGIPKTLKRIIPLIRVDEVSLAPRADRIISLIHKVLIILKQCARISACEETYYQLLLALGLRSLLQSFKSW